MSKPKSIPVGFASIQQFKKDRCRPPTSGAHTISTPKIRRDDRSVSNHSAKHASITNLSEKDISLHRFVDYAVDMQTKKSQLRVLKPNLSQVLKQANR